MDFTKIEQGRWKFELDIPMQMWLGLYVKPDPSDPATWENDNKLFSKTSEQLAELVKVAECKADEMLETVEQVKAWEAKGLTYAQVHEVMTGEKAAVTFSDKPFIADEDLYFQYSSLTKLYEFIFEARCCL